MPNQPHQPRVQKIMNAVIATGEYFSKKDNKNKKSYLTIGKLFIYPGGGMSLKLDAFPIGGQVINFYDIKPKNQPTYSAPTHSAPTHYAPTHTNYPPNYQ
jgi:hypothetical protein